MRGNIARTLSVFILLLLANCAVREPAENQHGDVRQPTTKAAPDSDDDPPFCLSVLSESEKFTRFGVANIAVSIYNCTDDIVYVLDRPDITVSIKGANATSQSDDIPQLDGTDSKIMRVRIQIESPAPSFRTRILSDANGLLGTVAIRSCTKYIEVNLGGGIFDTPGKYRMTAILSLDGHEVARSRTRIFEIEDGISKGGGKETGT